LSFTALITPLSNIQINISEKVEEYDFFMTSLGLNEICEDDQRTKNEVRSGRGKTS
jgi:hypothetical protein